MRGSAAPDLSRLDYGVLALGNRRHENFCGFGRRLSRWLGERGARAMFDTVEAHEAEADAIVQWRLGLGRRWPTLIESDVPSPSPAAASVRTVATRRA